MAMGEPIFRAKTGYDDVRPKAPDHPDDVRKDFVVIPKSQRLLGIFGEPKINCAGKELLPMIDPSRRQKFLRPDNAEFFAQLGAEKVLPAITARQRKITGIVKRSVRPKRNQRGVFVIRVRRQVKNAAEDIQLLEPKLNFARIHCIGKERWCRGHHVNCAEQARTGDDKALNDARWQLFHS